MNAKVKMLLKLNNRDVYFNHYHIKCRIWAKKIISKTVQLFSHNHLIQYSRIRISGLSWFPWRRCWRSVRQHEDQQSLIDSLLWRNSGEDSCTTNVTKNQKKNLNSNPLCSLDISSSLIIMCISVILTDYVTQNEPRCKRQLYTKF